VTPSDWIRRRLEKRFQEAASSPPRAETAGSSPSLDALLPSLSPGAVPREGATVDVLYVRSELKEVDARLKHMTELMEQSRERIRRENEEIIALRAALEEKEHELTAARDQAAAEALANDKELAFWKAKVAEETEKAEQVISILKERLAVQTEKVSTGEETLRERLKQEGEKIQRLERALEDARHQVDQWKNDGEMARRGFQQKEEEVSLWRTRVEVLERAVREKEQALLDKQKDVEEFRSRMQSQIASLPTGVRELMNEIEVLRERLSVRSETTKEMFDRIHQLEAELQAEKNQREELSRRLAETTAAPAADPEEIASLRAALADRDRLLAERDRALDDQRKTVETLSRVQKDASDQIRQLTAKSEELLQKLAEQRPVPQEAAPMAFPEGSFKEMETVFREELAGKSRALNEAEKRAISLETDLARRTAELAAAAKQAEDLKRKNDELETRYRELVLNSGAIERAEAGLREVYRLLGPASLPAGTPSRARPATPAAAAFWTRMWVRLKSLFQRPKPPARPVYRTPAPRPPYRR
jgi:chromosome segregation ATPase